MVKPIVLLKFPVHYPRILSNCIQLLLLLTIVLLSAALLPESLPAQAQPDTLELTLHQAQVMALKQVHDMKEQVRQRIAAEVESAHHALIQAEEQYLAQQKTVSQAQKSLQLAEVSYREGTATQMDILNAQLSLQEAQQSISRYLLQYNIARDKLLLSLNALKPPDREGSMGS